MVGRKWFACRLWEWSRAYIKDPNNLLINIYGTCNVSILVSDEDLIQDITLHLQSLGLKKTISHKTALRWMQIMGYWWGGELEGHERSDVVAYQQSIFLLAWAALEAKTHKFDNNGNLDVSAPVPSHPTVIWNHDESIFYAHDSETAKPYAKGEGASLMVADFVSPDYGWLQEWDQAGSGARVLLRPGKECDGYFTCEEVLAQATKAMDLLEQHFPNEDHVFIYDNATTHKKHANDALSAQHMPKYPPNLNRGGRSNNPNWGIKVPLLDPNGKTVHSPDGKVIKVFKRMANAKFADGTPQPLYFPDNHPQYPGLFKGMAVILEEHGFHNANSLKTECKNFKCKPGATDCCCHVLGYAKRVYHQYPMSSDPIALEKNALMALNSVPLLSMQR
ncbi:hypothetical protein BS47DRAFT_1374461 [Hydnum rufescens UP504]|uniref:Uncharacterized protein n=1 Tax=Hydnum rufescens UP504 TaxID=1448309 RepID=A0A9P6AD94_9AGAM|nr:hypothetical protein BS47DRAFT_1374461 [Hydnum rufescens UP504]